MRKPILEDKWAVKALKYLVRMEYSSEEILEAMIKIGIKEKEKDDNN